MWLIGLTVVGALVAIDGLVLSFYPEQLRDIFKRVMKDETPSFLGNRNLMRIVGILEVVLGLALLLLVTYLKRKT